MIWQTKKIQISFVSMFISIILAITSTVTSNAPGNLLIFKLYVFNLRDKNTQKLGQ